MRKYLPCLHVMRFDGCSLWLLLGKELFGCGWCREYWNLPGQRRRPTSTADDNGNVSVPCGDKNSLSMVQPTPSPDLFY